MAGPSYTLVDDEDETQPQNTQQPQNTPQRKQPSTGVAPQPVQQQGGVAPPSGHNFIDDEELEKSASTAIPRKDVTWSDVGKAAPRAVALGLGDTAGMIGSMGQLWDAGKEKLFEYGVAKPASALGLMPNGMDADKAMEIYRKSVAGEQTPAEQKGYVNKIFGIPFVTASGAEHMIRKAPGIGGQAQTPEQERVEKDIRAGTSLIAGPGGPVAMAGRFGAGAIGSEVGQYASELARGTGQVAPGGFIDAAIEPVASIAGTVAAQGLAGALKNIAFPTKAAVEGAAGAVQADIKSGQFNREAFEAAVRSGEPYRLIDFFGDKSQTRRWLSDEAGRSGAAGHRMLEDFNSDIGKLAGSGVRQRVPEAQSRSLSFLEQINRGPIDAGAVSSAVQDANKLSRSQIYSLMHAEPAAQAIPMTAFGKDVAGNEFIQKAVSKISGMSLPPQHNVLKPTSTAGVPPRPIIGPNGKPLLDASGNPVMTAGTPGTYTPGNLAFWDHVKRELYDMEQAATKSLDNRSTTVADAIRSAREALVRDLDNAVPSYSKTRSAAGELFGQDSAPQAGMDFYRRMNSIDRHEAAQAFQAMSPEARALFRTGFLSQMGDEIGTPNGLGSVVNKFVGNTDFQRSARMALGDTYDAVRGRLMAENARVLSQAIQPQKHMSPLGKVGLSAVSGLGVAGGLTTMAENLVAGLQQSFMLPADKLSAVLTGAVVAPVVVGAKDAVTRKIANRAVSLMLSENPADHVRLSRLLDADPNLAKGIRNLNLAVQMSREYPTPDEGRKDGGRIGRKSGGRISSHEAEADRLIMAAERAKRGIGQKTQSILEKPDEIVVQALKRANQALEA